MCAEQNEQMGADAVTAIAAGRDSRWLYRVVGISALVLGAACRRQERWASSVASAHVYGDEQGGAFHRVLVMWVDLAVRQVVPPAGLHLPESRQYGKLLWIQSGLHQRRG